MDHIVSGPSEDYDVDEEAELEAALDDAWNDYDSSEGEEPATGEPRFMTVKAEIEWAGEFARTPVRTVNFGPLDLTEVRDALTASRKANGAVPGAGSSYTAKGWESQLKELTKNSRGTAATDQAGLTVTRETLLKWLAGNEPNTGNQRRISAAYAEMRGQVVREARGKAERANHQVAEAVNRALAHEYGSEIRLRRIESLVLSD